MRLVPPKQRRERPVCSDGSFYTDGEADGTQEVPTDSLSRTYNDTLFDSI
jgi:hypothetical protein